MKRFLVFFTFCVYLCVVVTVKAAARDQPDHEPTQLCLNQCLNPELEDKCIVRTMIMIFAFGVAHS